MPQNPSLKAIMGKLPPPPPIKMRVFEYIDFLNFIESEPSQRGKVVKWLNEYNEACTKAGLELAGKLKGVLPKKR